MRFDLNCETIVNMNVSHILMFRRNILSAKKLIQKPSLYLPPPPQKKPIRPKICITCQIDYTSIYNICPLT